MKNNKSKKLSTKITIILAISLAVVFLIIGVVSVVSVSNIIDGMVNEEFSTLSSANAHIIQSLVDESVMANTVIVDYLDKQYEDFVAGDVSLDVLIEDQTSSVYPNLSISRSAKETENYFLNTLWSTVKNSDSIAGMAVMFEPYSFADTQNEYAIFVNNQAAESKSEDVSFEDYFDVDYYVEPLKSGELYITDPFEFEGDTIVTVSSPIKYDNINVGIVETDISTKSFLANIDTEHVAYPSFYVALFNNDGTYLMNSQGDELIGTSFNDKFGNDTESIEKIQARVAEGQAFQFDYDGYSYYFSPIDLDGNTWWLLNAVETADLLTNVYVMTAIFSALSIVSLIVLLLVTYGVIKKSLLPLSGLIDAAETISAGSFNVDIKVTSNDEIGILGERFNYMSNTLHDLVEEIQSLLYKMSKGDFTVEVSGEELYVGDLGQIRTSFIEIISQISMTMSQIKATANQVSAGAEQVSSGAQSLAQGATEQASSVEQLLATVETLEKHVSENAGNATSANEQTQKTGGDIQNSTEQMQSLMVAINEIQNTSTDISKIIKTIDDIAFQTNILALNAAVEAARAGQAGKGFAVVAEEVRNLAAKSAEAAKNTTDLIQTSLKAVERGTSIAQNTNEIILRITESSGEVVGAVESIATASNQQASSVSEISIGINQISAVVQTNSATSEESAATSEQLSAQAQTLTKLVSAFKLPNESSNEYHYDPNMLSSHQSMNYDTKFLEYSGDSKY